MAKGLGKALSLFHNCGNRWDYNVATAFTGADQPDGTGNTSCGSEIRRAAGCRQPAARH